MATLDQAISTLNRNEESLFSNPNVSFVSVVEDPESGGETNFAFLVGLVESDPEIEDDGTLEESVSSALDGFQLDQVPKELAIVGSDGVEIKEAGTISIATEVSGEITAQSFTDRRRPARGGNSCGNIRRNSAGTLGAAVNYRGTVHILSNWHVLYGPGGRDGDPIVQQARLDGGRAPRDVIARNTKGWLDAYRDLAVARVLSPWNKFVAGGSRCHGRFGSPKNASVGMQVKKCGRTTQATTGIVRSVSSTVRVNGYPGGARIFRDQIQTSAMARPGDSGSLLCESRTNSPVGVLFAGGSSGTWHNKIQRVMGQSLEEGEVSSDLLDDLDFNIEV